MDPYHDFISRSPGTNDSSICMQASSLVILTSDGIALWFDNFTYDLELRILVVTAFQLVYGH